MNSKVISIVLMVTMVAISLLSIKMHPDELISAFKGDEVQLSQVIPNQFNDWRIQDATARLVNPRVEKKLNKIYAETLSRAYVNSKGEMVMLSIAYGKNQDDSLGLHAPETCYGAQGFNINQLSKGRLDSTLGQLPVVRMLANKSGRIEPVTYWIRIGEKITYPGMKAKLEKIKYGLQGKVPDGLLFRVSTIASSADKNVLKEQYNIQTRFVSDLLLAIPASDRVYISGTEI